MEDDERKQELNLLMEAHRINGMDCAPIIQTMIDEFGYFWLPAIPVEED